MPKGTKNRVGTLLKETIIKEQTVCLIEVFLKKVVDPDNDKHFHLVFESFLNQGVIGIDQTADELLVSKPTIEHWARGRNLPNKHLRPAIYQWLFEKAAEHFRQQ